MFRPYLRTIHEINDTIAAAVALFSNVLLIFLIIKHTPKALEPYSRILLQACAIDLIYTDLIFVIKPVTNKKIIKYSSEQKTWAKHLIMSMRERIRSQLLKQHFRRDFFRSRVIKYDESHGDFRFMSKIQDFVLIHYFWNTKSHILFISFLGK